MRLCGSAWPISRPPKWRSGAPFVICAMGPSILSGPLHVIDDEEVAGPLCRLEFQPELLYRGKDRWDSTMRRRVGETSQVAAREEPWCGLTDRKFQTDIKLRRDPGLVDYRAVQYEVQQLG